MTIRISTALVALAITFLSCSRPNTDAEQGILDRTLLVGNQVEPEDLDPHTVTGVPEFHIIQALLEGLVVPDPSDLHPIPGVARSWRTSDDGLTWTFSLRADARWSDGSRLTAHDFVFSARRILAPALASEYAYMLYCLRGAEDYNKGRTKDSTVLGVEALDDTTLAYHLIRPTPYFLGLLMHHSWYPVPRAAVLAHGAVDQRGTPWTRPGNFVGNGPFALTSWQVNQSIVVDRNPFYWDSATVSLRRIVFYPYENQQTEERAFRAGQLHVTARVPPARIDWYRQNSADELRQDAYLGTDYYLLNATKPPLNNPLVRRALAHAIDRAAIAQRVLKGGQQAADCFTPHNTDGYTSPARFPFDTVVARALLAEAGYGPSQPFPPITLLYNTNETHHTVAQAVQQMWKQYLGIDVTLVNQEWKVYIESIKSRSYDIARRGWIGDYNDPSTFLDLWLSGGGNNHSGWSNAHYDSLIAEASTAATAQARHALFGEAEKVLIDQMPIIPMYFHTNVYLLHPAVKGWQANLLNMHPYKFVTLGG